MRSSQTFKGKLAPTIEEVNKRKFRVLMRFRCIARLALANAYWLSEVEESSSNVDLNNVHRRVAQAIRHSKDNGMNLSLTLAEKALLNKNADNRTVQEKRYLYKTFGSIKCFKRYPNNVKRRLAALVYFKYYGPNRVIVRQNQEAQAMYFVLTGQLVVTRLMYDNLLKEYKPVNVGTLYPGDMFGEVALLHGIPFSSTFTTAGHCELLQLLKKDFNTVLLVTVRDQWEEIRRAMDGFSYFNSLNTFDLTEGCAMAKLRSYAINETILGDGVIVPNHVYFVLSGNCQMIENIRVLVKNISGKKFYFLKEPRTVKNEDTMYNSELFLKSKPATNDKELLEKKAKTGDKNVGVKSDKNREDNTTQGPKLLISPSICGRSKLKSKSNISRTSTKTLLRSPENSIGSSSHETKGKKSSMNTVVSINTTDSMNKSRCGLTSMKKVSLHAAIETKTYFMQVCIFKPGSAFHFEDLQKNRRVVAMEPMKCMLLPIVWLKQKNTLNIWTRVQHYLSRNIPTTEKVFEKFLALQKWNEYSEEVVNSVCDHRKTHLWTSLHDVPLSIRMMELLDI